MLFKTNAQLEYKHPFKQHEYDRHYPAFELILNVGLFHADLVVDYKGECTNFRIISHDLDHVVRTIENSPIAKVDLYYQTARYEKGEDYRILKVKEIRCSEEGLKFTFFDDEIHEIMDSLQFSKRYGLIYSA